MVGTETTPAKTRFGYPIFEGWASIAAELGKSISSVKVYARREMDPLPVQSDGTGMTVWIYVADLCAWAERQGWPTQPGSGRIGQD